MKNEYQNPGTSIPLTACPPHLIRHVDKRLMSYNIEMTEVTGGTFWKSYTGEQIAGTAEFPTVTSFGDVTAMPELMEYYPPIDLYNKRLRELAKALGPAWIRVSGTWATKTYYDFEGVTGGKAPDGYGSVLTGEQWIGVLDFAAYVGAKLLISVSNCAGDHPNGGPLDLTQAKKIFDFSHQHGRDIDAVEFMNEPNMLELSGAPQGYTAADYARDQDILYRWVRANYPNCLLVGPCTTGDPAAAGAKSKGFGAGIASMTKTCTTEALLAGTQISLDVFSYHYYNGVSERIAGVLPTAHWPGHLAHSDEYLAVAPDCARAHAALRDRFVPGGQMWVTESGDAGGGGDTWASTYLDVLRTLNELGSYGTITDGIIFHNTLASSDYGFLEHGTFLPRPNYFAVLLWNRLMGTGVYDCGHLSRENAHVYCHSRRDGTCGVVYLIINNSLTDAISVTVPKEALRYTLHAETMRSSVMLLNGKELTISDTCGLPELAPELQPQGTLLLAPGSCTFLVL
ncbi:beta-glucuronidase [Dysosmobacter sp.]|jgi:heparanase 1|uniref:beta-glucuronidase n=1 Tax=Dysosmobacter sp. TaxID=2591382 RepID=UPI003D931A88